VAVDAGYSFASVSTPSAAADRAPRLIEGIQRRPMARGTVLARPDGGRHLLIPDAELAVHELLDGATGRDDLVARFGPAAGELLDDLALSGFLVGTPAEEDPRLTLSVAGVEFADSTASSAESVAPVAIGSCPGRARLSQQSSESLVWHC
jgi:hypothetical protein